MKKNATDAESVPVSYTHLDVYKRQKYGTEDPKILAGKMGMKVKMPKVPTGGGVVLFAQYVQPDEITKMCIRDRLISCRAKVLRFLLRCCTSNRYSIVSLLVSVDCLSTVYVCINSI